MWNIKLTSKNQATFPKALLEEMRVRPGERMGLVREVRGGQVAYRLVPPGPDLSWIGCARKYAKGKSHRMEDIRRSIGRAIGKKKGR
ncbi:MAG: hypothetical protein FD180_703 [Planctomycetota bacterium]|nr:MAG: hypothetical protein FD180_703 [Planctomycetota bacterium]